MPKKRRRVARVDEAVPLFTKLVRLEHRDDNIVTRSRSGVVEREGAMTKPLFMRLVVKGITLLNKIGYLPTFTALGPLEETADGRVAFRLGFKEHEDLYVEGFVTVEIADQARDELAELRPRRVVKIAGMRR